MAAPMGLVATANLNWRHVKSAASYRIQFGAGATLPTAFDGDVLVTRARGTVAGLASGTRYWFRVAAIGAAGPSLWTNAISVVTQ